MRQRKPINTETLRKRFPDVYREFFSRCEVVCSVSRGFSLAGDHAVQHGGVRVGVKLPWRTFVGCERGPVGTVAIVDYKAFSPDEDAFLSSAFDKAIEERLLSTLRTLSTSLSGSTKFSGFRIRVLTEGSFQRGTGTFTAFSSALAASLLLFFGKLEPEVVAKWRDVAVSQLVARADLHFDTVFQIALQLESLSEPPVVSGGRSFTNLVFSSLPVVYFWQNTADEAREAAKIVREEDIPRAVPRFFQQVKYAGVSLSELVTTTGSPSLPIDVLLIFSGVDATTGFGKISFQNARDEYRRLGHTLVSELFKKFKHLKTVPAYFHLDGLKQNEPLWKRVLDVSTIMSWEILARTLDLFKRGVTRESFDQFFLRFAKYHDWTKILGSYPKIHYHIWRFFGQAATTYDTPIGLKALASYGGDMLVMTPAGSLRDELFRLIGQLRRQVRKDVYVDYASWIDGFGSDGLVVEQCLTKNIYSSFVSQGAIVGTLCWNGRVEPRVYTLERFEEKQRTFDLLLDDTEEVIAVRGRPLTSRQIHSARATIDILKVLIANAGKSVPAASLPPSSYVDRNEMQSKILTPLSKVFRRGLKSELPISLHGSLRKNFRLRLEPSKQTIFFIEKRL